MTPTLYTWGEPLCAYEQNVISAPSPQHHNNSLLNISSQQSPLPTPQPTPIIKCACVCVCVCLCVLGYVCVGVGVYWCVLCA